MISWARQLLADQANRRLLRDHDRIIERVGEIDRLAVKAYTLIGCERIEVGPVRAAGTRRHLPGSPTNPRNWRPAARFRSRTR